MQQPRHRIRKHRHPVALGAATALVIASLASASSTLPLPSRASAGPMTSTQAAGLGPCRISTAMGVQMSEGMPTQPGYARSTGQVHALNLMIDFPDAPGKEPAMDRLAEFFPQTTDWFRTSSYGRLTYVPEAPVKTWLRMPLPFSEYGIERGSPYEPGYRHLVQDIVAAADPKVDFTAYDLVNILVTPNAGPSALDTVLSVTFSGNDDAPYADGVPLSNTSFVYSRRTTARARTPRPATASCRTRTAMSSACPTSTRWRAGARSGTGTSCRRTGAPITTCWAGTSGSSAGWTTARSAAPPGPAPATTSWSRWPPTAARSWRSYR